MLLQKMWHGVVIVNAHLQLYHAIFQKWCKRAPKLLCDCEVIYDLSNGVISNDLEVLLRGFQGHGTCQRRTSQKRCISET